MASPADPIRLSDYQIDSRIMNPPADYQGAIFVLPYYLIASGGMGMAIMEIIEVPKRLPWVVRQIIRSIDGMNRVSDHEINLLKNPFLRELVEYASNRALRGAVQVSKETRFDDREFERFRSSL